jgi:4-hydroxy-tetrahydrodipicolinate reductase
VTSTPRLAIIGNGKMGRAVAQMASDRGWPIVVTVGAGENQRGSALTRARLDGANVAVEFTTPEAAPDNIRACVAAGIPIVVGTTGWYGQLEAISAAVRNGGGAMLWSPNFSLGVNIFWQIAEHAATLAARVEGMDAHIIETHHTAKKDAPSGTALELGRRVSESFGRTVPITSVRVGAVPGTHQLVLDAPFEQIQLEHTARDRRVFAEGALAASRWLLGRRGVFTMRDLLSTEESS